MHNDTIQTTYLRGDGTELVRYEGTREALLAAGVVTEDMFPHRGQRRRFAGGNKFMVNYFAITQIGPRYLLTRWAYWREPDAEARSAVLVAARARRCAEVEAQVASEMAEFKAHEARAAGFKPTLVWSAPT